MSSTTTNTLGIPLIPTTSAPGNYLFEQDDSEFVAPLADNVGAIVVVTSKGLPIPVQFTNPSDYITAMGQPNWQISLAPYSAMQYLNAGFPLMVRRAVDTSYTNAIAFVDAFMGPVTVDLTLNQDAIIGAYLCGGNGSTFTPLAALDYDQGAKNTYMLLYPAAGNPNVTLEIACSNVLTGYAASATTNNLSPVSPATVVSTAQIAGYLLDYLNNYASAAGAENDYNVQVVPITSNDGATVLFEGIFIIAPTGVSLAFTNLSGIYISNENGVKETFNNDYSTNIFQIMAQGPGSYANNTIGFTLTNFNMGTPQVVQFTDTTGSSFTAGDVYNITYLYNGKQYTTGTWTATGTTATDFNSAATALLLSIDTIVDGLLPALVGNTAGAIESLAASNLFYPIQLDPAGTANPNIMSIQMGVYPIAGSNGANAFSSLQVNQVTSGGNTPISTITATNTLDYIAPTNTFVINVYVNSTSVISESFTVALVQQLDGSGNQQYIETVVNDPNIGSKYIAASYNANNPFSLIQWLIFMSGMVDQTGLGSTPQTVNVNNFNYAFSYSDSGLLSLSVTTDLIFLVGGDNTVVPSNAEIAAAWNDFSDTETTSVNILINGGYTDVSVLTAIDAVSTTRQDCEAALDMPTAYQTNGTTAVTFRTQLLNLNSDRSAIHLPDVQVSDSYTGQNIYIPPSGFAAVLWATNDFNVGPWQASAGSTYGILSGVLGLRYQYNAVDRGLMNGNGVNVIKSLKSGGIAIYGVKTLLTTPSLLQFLPIRRTLTYCEQIILNYMEGVDFLNITPLLEQQTANAIKKYLTTVQQQNGISTFKVITDSTINTTQYSDNGQFNIKTVIVPFVPAQFAVLDAVITDSLITFNESTQSA